MSSVNLVKIFNGYLPASEMEKVDENKIYKFSKNQKNVLILFVDRAISSYLPYIFEEKPYLKDIYSGFTYYPNTASFFSHTILAYPPLIGGYEYTPEALIKWNTVGLEKRHDEALLMLPTMFKNAGFNSIVTDAPFGSYEFVTPEELFTKRGIEYKNLIGSLGQYYDKELREDNNLICTLKRNFIYFGLFLCAPEFLREKIYNDGKYLDVNYVPVNQRVIDTALLESYTHLHILPDLTDFSSDKSSFIIVNNKLPHANALLFYPDYTLKNVSEEGNYLNLDRYSLEHYHVNMATIILLGKYLNFLKENNVYDNTRIIIVSDHGYDVRNPKFNKFQNKYVTSYNPLLMVKDFNSNGEFTYSNEFMTSADVPSIAVNDIISNPVNPFTKKKLSTEDKKNGAYINLFHEWRPDPYRNNPLPIEGKNVEFAHVKDNIFIESNWKVGFKYQDIK